MACARLWLIGALLLLGTPWAAAEPGAPARRGGQAGAARGLLEKGKAALQAQDLVGARRALEQAYRAAALPEVLYILGRVAEADGRRLDAHDLMRRFLIDPARIPDDEAVTEAQRVVKLARPPSGQIVVLGDPGSLISVDDRLVGSVPLAQPLLVSPGEHRITLQLGGRRLESPVAVQAGRSFEVRFTRSSGAVLITLLPAVLWITEQVGIPEEEQNPLADAAGQAARAANQTLLTVEAALAQKPELKDCLATIECQQSLARKNEVEYVLKLQLQQKLPASAAAAKPTPLPPAGVPASAAAPPVGTWQLKLSLWHTDLATPAATGAGECERCTAEQAALELKKATAKLLAEGLRRGHGSLLITSEPSAAELLIDGQPVGRTPYQHAAWSGTYALAVGQKGYAAAQRTIEVSDGKPAEVAVTLDPLSGPKPAPLAPKPAAPIPPRRPTWRLATGAGILGTSVVLLGFGIAAATKIDTCAMLVSGICTTTYDTRGPTVGLFTIGSVLAITGAVMLAIPPSKPRPPRPLAN